MYVVIAFDSGRDVVWVAVRESVDECKAAAEQWCENSPNFVWEDDWSDRRYDEIFQYSERVALNEDVEFNESYYVELFKTD